MWVDGFYYRSLFFIYLLHYLVQDELIVALSVYNGMSYICWYDYVVNLPLFLVYHYDWGPNKDHMNGLFSSSTYYSLPEEAKQEVTVQWNAVGVVCKLRFAILCWSHFFFVPSTLDCCMLQVKPACNGTTLWYWYHFRQSPRGGMVRTRRASDCIATRFATFLSF